MRLHRLGDVDARGLQCPCIGFIEIDRGKLRATRDELDGQITIAGTEIGDLAGQRRRQGFGEQGRGRVDAVPGEQPRTADEAGRIAPRRVQCEPVGQQHRIRPRTRRVPEHPAFVLGKMPQRTGQPGEVGLGGAGALRVGCRSEHHAAGGAMTPGAGKERARRLALTRRPDHDQGMARIRRRLVHPQAHPLQGGGEGPEVLLAMQVDAGQPPEHRAGAGIEEQHAPVGRPRQLTAEQRQPQGAEDGFVGVGHGRSQAFGAPL